jgi:hypothetical protein
MQTQLDALLLHPVFTLEHMFRLKGGGAVAGWLNLSASLHHVAH